MTYKIGDKVKILKDNVFLEWLKSLIFTIISFDTSTNIYTVVDKSGNCKCYVLEHEMIFLSNKQSVGFIIE